MTEEGLLENYNNLKEIKPKYLPKEVWIWDETLRDGEQTPGVFLTNDEKIEIAKLLDDIGVAVIAAGFPAISKKEAEAVKRIAQEGFRASIAAPARSIRSDIDACIDCGVDEIPLFIASSNLHLKYKLNMTKDEVKSRVADSVQYAKDHGVVVDFILEDSSRSEFDFMVELYKTAIEAGADRICACDTVGFLYPLSMKNLMGRLRDEIWKIKKIPLAVHCHNDFGLACANTLAAVEEGVTFPLICINGYGERAGNAALEEVVMSLEVLYRINTHIKTEMIYELSTMTEKYFTIPIPIHKAIVGANAFSHEAGIHVHGELGHPLSYEPMAPESIGRERRFILGKFTGRHIIRRRLQDKKINANDDEICDILDKIKKEQETIGKKEMRAMFDEIKNKTSKMHSGLDEKRFWEIVFEVIEN